MKTYKSYALYAINTLSIIAIASSFLTLQKSIQIEQKQQEKEETQVFITENVLPSTPRVMNIAKAKVKKITPKTTTTYIKSTIDTSNIQTLATFKGNISHYGGDCVGCSGITASGYNIRNSIYYNDKTYGTLNIVAADSSLPFGTVIRINGANTQIYAIVLDRGGAIGFNKKFMLDMLCQSEKQSYQLGIIKNATVEVLRYGF